MKMILVLIPCVQGTEGRLEFDALERCRSWPNGVDSKSSEHSRAPRVRIPPSPPLI